MGQYLPIFALLVLAVVFGAVSRVVSRLLAPRRPSLAKSAPYECGITGATEPPERFPVTFFLVAMIFIVFDIEIIFLYPWAVVYRQLGAFGLWEMLIFALAVFVSFIYLIGNGALALLQHPLQRERFLEDPAVADTAIDELLRYTSPIEITPPLHREADLRDPHDEWSFRRCVRR